MDMCNQNPSSIYKSVFKQNIKSLHSEQCCVFIPPYLEQHFCLLQTDDSLTRILLQAINHVLEGDHRHLQLGISALAVAGKRSAV